LRKWNPLFHHRHTHYPSAFTVHQNRETRRFPELIGLFHPVLYELLMKLVLSAHNVKLSDAIETHIFDKIHKLEHIDGDAIDARVTVEHDHTRVSDKQFNCSVRISVPGPDLYAEDSETDLCSAIDLVMKKIEQQIRKRQNKDKARKHKLGARSKKERQETPLDGE
jgi:putative sigma-54 modulation protein